MQVIALEKTMPDGIVFNYHSVYEIQYPEDLGFISLIVGSYTENPALVFRVEPEYKTTVTVFMDRPAKDFVRDATKILSEFPDWSGKLLDTSIPIEYDEYYVLQE